MPAASDSFPASSNGKAGSSWSRGELGEQTGRQVQPRTERSCLEATGHTARGAAHAPPDAGFWVTALLPWGLTGALSGAWGQRFSFPLCSPRAHSGLSRTRSQTIRGFKPYYLRVQTTLSEPPNQVSEPPNQPIRASKPDYPRLQTSYPRLQTRLSEAPNQLSEPPNQLSEAPNQTIRGRKPDYPRPQTSYPRRQTSYPSLQTSYPSLQTRLARVLTGVHQQIAIGINVTCQKLPLWDSSSRASPQAGLEARIGRLAREVGPKRD